MMIFLLHFGWKRLSPLLSQTWALPSVYTHHPILERRSTVLLLLLLLLLCHAQATPLDSEAGWTEELWSMTISLIGKTKKITLFSREKIFTKFSDEKQQLFFQNFDNFLDIVFNLTFSNLWFYFYWFFGILIRSFD